MLAALLTLAQTDPDDVPAPDVQVNTNPETKSRFDAFIDWLSRNTPGETTAEDVVIQTLIVLLILFVLRWILLRIVRKRVGEDVRLHYNWRRAINYLISILGLLAITPLWFGTMGNIGTFLGLVSAGIAIALQDPLVNFAGWVFIVVRRPFAVGDRIEIDGKRGDIIDIRIFQFHMLECGHWVDADQSTGRILMVPNGYIFKHITANFTRGFHHIWDELPVLITFESDWRKAKEILTEIADKVAEPLSEGAQEQIREAARKQMIFFSKLTPIVYTSVKDSGVMLTIRFLTMPRQRRGVQERMWEAILDAFAKEQGIDLAYPTVRYYRNETEGKPGTKPVKEE